MPAQTKSLTGSRVGRWLVAEEAGRDKHGFILYRCVCECGGEKVVKKHVLAKGESKSCGCWHKEAPGRKFSKYGGYSKQRVNNPTESRAYGNMIDRCHNPNSKPYEWYGGRGITVCSRWMYGENGVSGFDCFLQDMGRKPFPNLTLERVDNDAGYSPQNCKWASRKEQAANRRDAWITRKQRIYN